MRIILISDTHGLHARMSYPLPNGEVLIHAGDCTNIGEEHDLRRFMGWFQNQNFGTKIFISGNHDWCFERKEPWVYQLLSNENLHPTNCHYLEDNSIEIISDEFSRPIKIYGTPWQPEFYGWAFNVPRDQLYKHWEKIPLDTDILITHGAPEGICDANLSNFHTGCSSLRHYVETKIKPTLNVFGHIHEAYGYKVVGETLYVNASTCTRRYIPSNEPVVVDLTEVDGKLIANIIPKL